MFTRIQAHHYRVLRLVDQTIGPFQALVGPNASGKTTFMDLLILLRDLMQSRGDVPETIFKQSADFNRLLWKGEGESFELAIEAEIPEELSRLIDKKYPRNYLRYELEIGLDKSTNEIGLDREVLWLFDDQATPVRETPPFFPDLKEDLPSIFWDKKNKDDRHYFINKQRNGNDNFSPETSSKAYKPSFHLGRTRSALANLPPDSSKFPVALWFRETLEKGVQNFILDSQKIRQPSPPGLGMRFQTDGSNLPWVINNLRKDQERFSGWLEHVQTALEDVRDIRTIEREEDRHRYLVVDYANGASVPSWLVSDGTLRLLALTIPAYLKEMNGVFLIEEPENGIHPRAIETVIQSLTSIYHGQVLIATHSPVVLNQLKACEILCFAKDKSGATDIVSGDLHPALSEWKQGRPELGTLLATGILS